MTAYSDSHENVTLKQQAVPRADYESTMSTQIGSGEGPDLLIVPPAFLYQAGDAGILEPLDGILRADSEAALMSNNERVCGEQPGTRGSGQWAITEHLETTVDVPTTPKDFHGCRRDHCCDRKSGFAGRHLTEAHVVERLRWPCGFGNAGPAVINFDRQSENIKAATACGPARLWAMPTEMTFDFPEPFCQREIGMMIDNASVAFTVWARIPCSVLRILSSALAFPTVTLPKL